MVTVFSIYNGICRRRYQICVFKGLLKKDKIYSFCTVKRYPENFSKKDEKLLGILEHGYPKI